MSKTLLDVIVLPRGFEAQKNVMKHVTLYITTPSVSLGPISQFLETKPDINIQDSKGWTPLMRAVYLEDYGLVELLLQQKPDLSIQNNQGQTVFDIKTPPIIRDLLYVYDNQPVRANKEQANVGLGEIALYGKTPLSQKLAVEYIDLGVDPYQLSKNDTSPILNAIRSENLPMLRLFLKEVPEINNQDEYGLTALHYASGLLPRRKITFSDKVSPEVIDLLLKNDADSNIQDVHGWTPLMIIALNENAVPEDRIKGVKSLLTKGRIAAGTDITDKNRTTAIQLFFETGGKYRGVYNDKLTREMLELFLEHKANLTIPNAQGRTIFDLLRPFPQEIRQLLVQAYIDRIIYLIKNGFYPYYLDEFNAILKLLTKSGIKLNEIKVDGKPLGLLAMSKGPRGFLEPLLYHGLNPDQIYKGKTLLMILGGEEEGVRFDLDDYKNLLKYGASVDLADAKGNLPILYSINGLSKGNQVDIPRKLQALDELLQNKKNDINGANDRGVTPLILASKKNNFQVVDTLLNAGAKPNIEDKTGKSALDYAMEYEPTAKGGVEGKVTTFSQLEDRMKHNLILDMLHLATGREIVTTLKEKKEAFNYLVQYGYGKYAQELVKQYIESGVNPVEMDSIFYPIANRNLKMIETLINNGVPVNETYRIQRTGNRVTALNYVSGEQEPFIYTPQYFERLDINPMAMAILIRRGADVNTRDSEEKTPLMRVVSSNYGDKERMEALELLLKNRANVNLVDKDGNTALLLLLSHEWYIPEEKQMIHDVAKLLLRNGANPTIKNKKGENALDYLVNYPPFIQKLFRNYLPRDTKFPITEGILTETEQRLRAFREEYAEEEGERIPGTNIKKIEFVASEKLPAVGVKYEIRLPEKKKEPRGWWQEEVVPVVERVIADAVVSQKKSPKKTSPSELLAKLTLEEKPENPISPVVERVVVEEVKKPVFSPYTLALKLMNAKELQDIIREFNKTGKKVAVSGSKDEIVKRIRDNVELFEYARQHNTKLRSVPSPKRESPKKEKVVTPPRVESPKKEEKVVTPKRESPRLASAEAKKEERVATPPKPRSPQNVLTERTRKLKLATVNKLKDIIREYIKETKKSVVLGGTKDEIVNRIRGDKDLLEFSQSKL